MINLAFTARSPGSPIRSWLLFVFVVLVTSTLIYADDIPTSARPRIDVYRSEVPLDLIQRVTNNHRIMRRAEFERLLKTFQSRDDDDKTSEGIIKSAVYRCWLNSEGVLIGSAEFNLRAPADNVSVQVLDPLNVAVGRTSWANASRGDPIFGTLPAGKTGVILGEAGDTDPVLEMQWSLRSTGDSLGTGSFDFALPRALSTTFFLEAPAGVTPQCNVGIVTALDTETDTDVRSWRLDLGAASRFKVQLHSESTNPSEQVFLRQVQQYKVGPSVTELIATLYLDVYDKPIDRLKIQLDRSLTLSSVTFQEQRATWSQVATTNGTTTQDVVLPAPMSGVGQWVRVVCRTPTVIDERWRLPTLMVSNAHWREGSTTLQISRALEVTDLQPQQARIVSNDFATSAESSTIGIQSFTRTSSSDLQLRYRPQTLTCKQGTSVELRADSFDSKTVATIAAQSGEIFTFECYVPSSWRENDFPISFSPDSIVNSYELERWSRAKPMRTLRVRLNKPITIDDHLTIEIRGTKPIRGQRLSSRQLPLLVFSPTDDVQHHMWLNAPSPTDLKLTNDERIERVSAAQLDATTQMLIDAPPSADVLRLEPQDVFGLSIEETDASYSSSVRCEITLASDYVDELITATCIPTAGDVTMVRMHVNSDSDIRFDWRLSGQVDGEIQARRLTTEEQTVLGVSGGQLWEVELSSAMSDQFQLVAARRVPSEKGYRPLLASFLEAETQRGALSISGDVEGSFRLNLENMRPLPVDVDDPSVREFLYDPVTLPDIQDVTVSHEAQRSAVVWDCDVYSAYESNGMATHTAKLRIENAGATNVSIAIPPRTELAMAKLTGERVELQRRDDTSFVCKLPSEQRWVDLEISYTEAGAAFKWFQQIHPRVPTVDSQVLSGRWHVQLSPTCQPLWRDDREGNDAWKLEWCQRLFGPLARPVSTSTIPAENPETDAESSGPIPSKEFSVDFTPGLIVVCQEQTFACSWGAMVLAISISWWLGLRSPRWSLLFWAVVAAMSMTLPNVLAPLGGAASLGCMIGVMAALLPHRSRSQSAASPQTPSAVNVVGATLLFMLLVVLPSDRTNADDVPRSRSTNQRFEVIVPLNAKGEQQDSFYLPTPLYQMLRRVDDGEATSMPHVIRSATYDLQLMSRDADSGYTLAPVIAKFQLSVPEPSMLIDILLLKSQVGDVDIRVDGRLATASWNETEDAVLVELPDEGVVELALEFTPTEEALADTNVRLQVPSIANSHVVVATPPGNVLVTFPKSRGNATHREEYNDYRVQHGSSSELVVSWAKEQTVETQLESPSQQLEWLVMRPGAVYLDTKLTFPPQSTVAKTLDLLIDPRLRVPPTSRILANGQVVSHKTIDRGSHKIISFELDENLDIPTEGLTINPRFLVTHESGVGNLLVPQVRLASGIAERHLLAVSVGEGLRIDQAASMSDEFVDADLFLERWGETEERPSQVTSVKEDGGALSIVTTVRAPDITPDELVDVHFGRDRWFVDYVASVQIDNGETMQLRAAIPQASLIRSLELRSQQKQILVRRSVPTDGELVITSSEGLSGSIEIAMELQVAASYRPSPLPTVWLEGTSNRSHRIDLFQTPQVSTRVTHLAPGAEEIVDVLRTSERALDIHVASYSVTDVDAMDQSSVEMARNQPVVHGSAMTQLVRVGSNWRCTYIFDGFVQGGRLDYLRLRCPATWGNDFQAAAGYEIETFDPIGSGSVKRLLVRSTESLEGRFRAEVTASFDPSDVEFNVLPKIGIDDVETTQHFVRLPTMINDVPVQWNHGGMRPAELPKRLVTSSDTDDTASFRITSSNYRATLNQTDVELEPTSIGWAEYQIELRGQTRVLGTASFALLNPSATEYAIDVPAGMSLLSARIDDQRVSVEEADGYSRIPIGKRSLAVRLDLIFQTDCNAETAGASSIALPQIHDVPVARSVITLNDIGRVTYYQMEGDHISQAEYARRRLQMTSDIMERGLSRQLAVPTEMRTRWYRYWMTTYLVARQRVLRHRSILESTTNDLVDELDQRQRELAVRAGLLELHRSLLDEAPISGTTNHNVRQEFRRRSVIYRDGATNAIKLVRVLPRRQLPLGQIFAACTVLGLGFLLCANVSRMRVYDLIHRFGAATLLTIGLFWVGFLSPSFVGCVIAACGASLAFVPRFRTRPETWR